MSRISVTFLSRLYWGGGGGGGSTGLKFFCSTWLGNFWGVFLISHYSAIIKRRFRHKDQLTDYPRDSLKPLILITFYPMPLHLLIVRFFQVERIWYFLLKSTFIGLFLCIVCVFSTSNKHNFVFIFIHILSTVQHSYPIIIQCSESFSLEKLYFRLNDICGVLQLYDPAQGFQHSACFFL